MYAVLHLPDFALQAVLRTESGPSPRPAALFTDRTKKSVVLLANRDARAAGVTPRMTAPQALARCPGLLVRVPHAAAEADARAALLAVGFTLSPTIEDTAPGVCTIDLKGTEAARHDRAAAAAIAQLTALGFEAGAGLGATPLLALYAARQATEPRSVSSTPPSSRRPQPVGGTSGASHPAADLAGPDQTGVATARPRVVSVTDAAAFLAPLPLVAADPPAEVAGILAGWGLRTLGDLTALPRDDIGRRLGPAGLSLWDRAYGGAIRPLHPVARPRTFAASMDFEDGVETLEPLLFILRRFLERLTVELRSGGHVAAALELTLLLEDETAHPRSFRLPEPTADPDTLFRTLHTHLESLRTDAAIVRVALGVTPTRPLVRQQGLFDTGLRDPHGFAETLARVVAIVGSDRVGTPQRGDTHRPDAVVLRPPPPVIPPSAGPPVHAPFGLPLRRYRPPLRAQLELTNGRPTYLWTESFNGGIIQIRGPWLSSGDWWQSDRAWRRTEYDVELATGGLYRLVLANRSWFVEGEYD